MGKSMKRLEEIDILRGIAILGVIAIHTSIHANEILYAIANKLTRFAVPFFIIISGFVLFYNYGHKKINYIRFIERRAKFVLIPYIFFTFLYCYIFHQKSFAVHLLIGDAAPHLYFIILIFSVLLTFPFICISYKLSEFPEDLLPNNDFFGIMYCYSISNL